MKVCDICGDNIPCPVNQIDGMEEEVMIIVKKEMGKMSFMPPQEILYNMTESIAERLKKRPVCNACRFPRTPSVGSGGSGMWHEEDDMSGGSGSWDNVVKLYEGSYA